MEPRENEPTPAEREPQVHDVVESMRHLIAVMAPDTDPEDVAYIEATVGDAVDLEDALGVAAGMFDMVGIDYDEGLARLGEILQVEEIRPNPS